VRIAARDLLEDFAAIWQFHAPLQPEQFAHADKIATVKSLDYFHSGDALLLASGGAVARIALTERHASKQSDNMRGVLCEVASDRTRALDQPNDRGDDGGDCQ
jgi:hypothetical protein